MAGSHGWPQRQCGGAAQHAVNSVVVRRGTKASSGQRHVDCGREVMGCRSCLTRSTDEADAASGQYWRDDRWVLHARTAHDVGNHRSASASSGRPADVFHDAVDALPQHPAVLLAAGARLYWLIYFGSGISVDRLWPQPGVATTLFVSAACMAGLLGAVFVGLVIRREEWLYLSRLNAYRMAPGQYPDTRSALHDVSLAAGLPFQPALFLIPDDVGVNAIVLGRTPRSAAVAVTRGLATRTDTRLQRAVFASLLSRFREDGVSWTSLLFMLIQPIRAITHGERWDVAAFHRDFAKMIAICMVPILCTWFFLSIGADLEVPFELIGLIWLLVSMEALLGSLWVIVTLVALSQRGAYSTLTRSADAEGVLLLRNPDDLLGALRAVLRENTWLSGGQGLSYLSFVDCWRHPLDDETYGTEDARLAQLEELAYPAGGRDLEPMRITPLPQAEAAN